MRTSADPLLGDLSVIARTYLWDDANSVARVLRAAGLPAFLLDQHLVSTNPSLGLATGGIRIAVPRHLHNEALSIVDTIPAPVSRLSPLALGVVVFFTWFCGYGPAFSGLYLQSRRPDDPPAAIVKSEDD